MAPRSGVYEPLLVVDNRAGDSASRRADGRAFFSVAVAGVVANGRAGRAANGRAGKSAATGKKRSGEQGRGEYFHIFHDRSPESDHGQTRRRFACSDKAQHRHTEGRSVDIAHRSGGDFAPMAGRSIAIAGCGIAGLACASLLARDGARVTVFDRLEKPEPLGSGLILQPVGLAVLDEIGPEANGAGARVRELGAPIQRLFGRVHPSSRVVLDVRYRELGAAKQGVAVHRGALFEALLVAAMAAGVEIAPGSEIVGASDGRLTFAGGGQSATFDLVIDALGVKSPLSRGAPMAPLPFGALWANLDWVGAPFDEEALEQRYEAARMMVGVLPIGRLNTVANRQAAFFWSLKRADHAAWRGTNLDAWKEEVLRLWPETAAMLGQIRSHDQMIFATYSHGTLVSPLANGVVHVGDSWHSASPQLGQGANMALLDSLALARALGSRTDLGESLEAYARARRWHIRLYQLASWMFTPAYQSDSLAIAWVRDWLVAPLSRIWPAPGILAALVAGSIGSPLRAIAAIEKHADGALPSAAGAN